MARWKLRNKFNAGSYYIGSGNRSDVFTRKSRVAFEDIIDKYDSEKKNKRASVEPKFTKEQIQRAKLNLRHKLKIENRNKWIKMFVADLVSIAIIYLLYELFFLLLDFIESYN